MIEHNMEQRTDEWFAIRSGKPTASNANKLITGTGKESKQMQDFAYELAADMYIGTPQDRWEGNEHTERGIELEPVAIDAYELDKGVWVEKVGFVTDVNDLYGCSPDGLVGDDGMVEIKCLSAKNHIKNMVFFEKNKRAMADYVPQAQMQLLVCGRAWCDLVYYHPDLPLLVIRQEPDEAIQKVLAEQLEKCLKIRDDALSLV